jgi:uncharacterized membrane-anchored protein YjiN (DUF445 family)
VPTDNVTSIQLSDAEQQQRLQRMKVIPLVLLLFMAGLYALSRNPDPAWLAWLNAFSEAAMVGALADWFAVTALFRHPMGIPIPHTAIIPRRKDEIGDSMAQFVADNFMEPAAIRGKLHSAGLSVRIAGWLSRPESRTRIASMCLRTMSWVMAAIGEAQVRQFIRRVGERNLQSMPLAPLAGKALEILTEHGRHQEILTQVLRFCIVMLHENREKIRGRVQQESPWWIPGFVDDKIVKQMLGRIETLLFEMSLDPDHEVRGRFNQHVTNLAVELQTSKEYLRMGEKIKNDMLQNEALHDYVLVLWNDLQTRLAESIDSPESGLGASLAEMFANLGDELSTDTGMQQWLDEWLTGAIVEVVNVNRVEISSLISDTVRSWDPKTTSRRVELAIGRDLQFIRINGTLVGGLVGIIIHLLEVKLG